MPRFLIQPDSVQGDDIRLAVSDARHALNALRLRVGDLIDCSLPDGQWARARLTLVGSLRVEAVIVERCRSTADPRERVTVLQALAKGDTVDRIIQGLSEIGAAEVIPVISERSVGVPPPDRRDQRVARWRRIAEESCKQCGRTTPLEVRNIIDLPSAFADLVSRPDLLLVASPKGMERAAPQVIPSHGPLVIAIGPEGGFSDEELSEFAAADAKPLCLGPRVLRCETAALVACALAMDAMGELLRPEGREAI